MESLGSDLQMEMAEREKMLENLKLMVRDKDEIIRKKDSELQEAKASLSKFKLQSKAKITKLNHQLEEAKKASIPDNASDKSSECGEELPTEQANRAKMRLLRRKIDDKDRLLSEKDEQLAGRDQQIAAKENVIEERNQVIQQREEMIRTITNQLHERDKIINDMGQSEKQPSGEQIDQIYAQILYKDKLIVDLNNKILELDRKIIDLQEFAGEKNEVVKGRDKVIKVLQTSIVEKDQNVTSQAALIKKLTSKVEASEENLSLLTEKLEKAEHNLKVESERFHLRLNETQKYFEETLGERESEISQLRDIIREREKDVATRDSNLRDLLIRHEQDLQEIMSHGEGSMQDHVVKMLEQKLRDINGVLDSKVQVIEVLTSEVADKERQLLDTGNTVKALKEKLAISSEQNLLQQQTFADLEMQWKEERSKLEMRLRASAEKLEEERGELNLQLHTLQMSLRQYEAAYSQAAVQYNALQERYQQTYLEVQALKSAQSATATSADQSLPSTDHSDLLKQLESETAQRKKLEEQVGVQEKEISKLQKVQMSESFSEKTALGEKVRGSKQRQSPEKSVASTRGESKAGDKQKSASDSPGSKASEAKLLKVKAQYTAKIKTLEKEIEALKKSGGGPVSPDVETLQNRLAEVEEEKGNLMLHLVDFDDTRALQGQLEKQLSDMQKQNQSLQDETRDLHQQLEEAHLETSHLLERISQMQQADEHIRAQYANEKAELLANEEAQKMQMKLQLDQLQEECNRLTNQLQEDARQQDSLQKQLQSTESCIGELRAQVQASNAAVEELQKNLVERSEQTSKLAGEKVGLEVRAAELEEIRDKLEQEKSELLTKVESLQTRIEFEKQPNLAFEKESQHLQLKIQELTEEISKEKGLSKVHKDQINELLPKLQQLENEKWQMEAERNQLGEQLMALSKAKVTCQSQQTEILQAELDTTSKELFKVKQEREEMIENLALSQKHTEDLQKRLILENEKAITTEAQLQDVQNQLTTVQAKLETANNALHQLQTSSSGQEGEVSLLKAQLDKREEQLQNLSSELADLLKTGDEQQIKLAKKDEKMMSLLENMQELEEQLTSLGNQREADIAKLTAELTEKTASLEEAEKSLQTKETQYLKVLATAKKLKLQGEAAKKEASQALSQLKEFKDKVLAESSTSALDQAAVQLPSQDSAEKKEVTSDDMDNKSSERLQELTMQVESFSEYCQQLQLQVQALTEKLHTAEQLANTKQMQLEALQSVSDEKESLATSQNELLEGFEAKLASLQDEKETLANVVVSKEEMIQTIRNRVEELDKKIKSLETETEKDARIRLLNEQLDETGKTMHSLQEEISLREEKLQESKNSELRAKDEHQKVIEQMNEQLKKAEEVGKAKQEISEQLASQMFDLSEQLQAKSVRVEELSCLLQSSDDKIKLLEVQVAEGESSLNEFKQQLQTVRNENGELVEELKSLKDLYNTNQEQLITQQKDLESKEQELLNVQKELDSLKDSLPKEELLQEYKQQLENQKTIETVPETSAQMNPNVSGQSSASYEKTLDQTIIEFPEPDFSSMYESLKLEFDLVFSEKERLSFENLELKNSLTDVQQKEAESLLKQQSYEVRIQQLEEGLQVSKSNMATLEDSLESVNEQLSRSTEEKKHLLKEKEKLTAQLAELLENKKVQETAVEADKVPFVEKIEQEFHGPLHQVKIEREAVQRSAAGPAEGVQELEHMKELYEKLSDEHTRLKNKQQVAEVKCEKMLIKLKAFKEKNENLLRELSDLKDSQNKSAEGIASQNEDLEAEKQKHQETQNLLLAEQANVTKERAKIAKMETVFRNKFQEVLDEKNHLGDSCNQLKTKCKELGARLKELLAERQDLQNSIDHLTRESETVLEGVRNEYAVEKSSLQSKISSLETECNNAYSDIEDFQKLVSKMKESHEALLGENQKLKNSAHQLESELVNSQSVEEKIGRLELEVQGLQEERKSLQDQVEVAREEALAKMKELQIARKKQGDAKGKTKLQEEQINQLKELNETLQNAKWALEANLKRSQHQAEHSEQERKTLIDEVTILRQATTDNEVLKGELALVESEAERKEQSIALFKHEVDTLNEQVQSLTSQCRDLESTRQAITVLKKENGSLTEDVIRLNAENAELKSAKEELGVVSDRYNNLLQDNTALAKQIEELLTKLQKQSQLEKDLSFAHEQQGHLEREQATFIQRIEELEEQSQQLTNQNTQLKQEMVQVNSALKQAQFENESLKSQLQVMQSGGDRLSRFQEEYEKLQQQFAQSVEQNNQVQAELNHSTHRLQLREARCQQLAMQVSQLAEDRSYLNIQMGNLSLALREKEKEASNLSSQCKTWYEKHCQLQQKITELETSRAEALKSYNSQNEIAALNEKIYGLEAHQEELTKLNLEQASQFTSEREQRLLAETNLIQMQEQIKILQQQQLQSAQDFQIQIDEDQDRVLEAQPLLSRHGSSFIHRLQRWMMVKNRQLSRLMRLQPRARTLIRLYFLLLHVAIVAFLVGLL